MRLQKKSISKVNFLDIIRRRKTTLTKFLDETGIASYNLLVARCDSMGVNPPTEKQFLEAKVEQTTPDVSSPTEGVVILSPPEIIVESTGKADKIETTIEQEFQPIYVPPQYPKRKKTLDKPIKKIIEENSDVQKDE